MRSILLMVLLFCITVVKAQIVVPASLSNYAPGAGLVNTIRPDDSLSKNKWSFSRYNGLSTSIAFFKGGNTTTISAPMILQLNRRLTDNWYAFANVAVAPAYTSFNNSFLTADFNKSSQKNGFYQSNHLGIYSSASLGVMYMNDAKTFSISGSISVEKNNYPLLPYYPISGKSNPVIPSKQ